DLEPALLEARQDLSSELSLESVGLDEDERRLNGQSRMSLLSASPLPERARGLEPLRLAELRRRRLDRRLAEGADLPERLHSRLAVHAGLLELRRADRAHQEVPLA